MRIVSWNVNGINSCVKHGGFDPFYEWLPDIICCQETKNLEKPIAIDGYKHYYLPANKKRFCGMLIMTLIEPKDMIYGLGDTGLDAEARVMAADFGDFYLVNTYAPTTVDRLSRGLYRVEWDKAYREYVKKLIDKKPAILCGDFNVSLSSLDYYDDNIRKIKTEELGFASDERVAMEDLMALGFVDAYRYLYPYETDCFTNWPNRLDARNKDRGARLDYFFVHKSIIDKVKDVCRYKNHMGSDHCPIELKTRVSKI